MKVILLIVHFFWVLPLCAQTLVEGVIVDHKKNPVGYATIGIKGAAKSTISNEDGVFKLFLNELPQTCIISAIGFELAEVEINSSKFIVSLNPKSYALNEVVVKSVDAYKVFFNAYKKLMKPNYRYYDGNLFYRLVTRNDSVNTELMEGFYEARVAPAGFYNWQLKHGRYAIAKDYKQQQYVVSIDFSALARYVDITNDHNSSVKFPLFPFRTNAKLLYHFQNIGSAYLNGKYLRKIEFIPLNVNDEAFSGVAYIDEESSLLYKLETSYNSKRSFLITSQDGKYPCYNLLIRYTIDFAEATTKEMLLSNINIDLQYEFAHLMSNKRINTSIRCFVFDKNTPVKTMPKTIKRPEALSDYEAIRSRLYIKEFWDENTILVQTDLEKSITMDFEQKGSFGQAYGKLYDTLSILKEGYALLNKNVNRLITNIQAPPVTLKVNNCIALTMTEKTTASLCSQLFVSHNCYKDSFYVLVLPLLDTMQTWISDSVKQDESFSFVFGLYSKLTMLHAQMLYKQLKQLSNPCKDDEIVYQLSLKANEELISSQTELLKDCWTGDGFKFWERYLEKLGKEN